MLAQGCDRKPLTRGERAEAGRHLAVGVRPGQHQSVGPLPEGGEQLVLPDPALERLQKKGWITSKWAESPTGRRARYYTITAAGRRQLGEEISSFDRVLVAIERVMRGA